MDELLADGELRRSAFPATRRVFFAHAAVSPLPRRVVEAMTRYAERAMQDGQFNALHRDQEDAARRKAAALLACEPGEIAFVPSTSAGISLVARGLSWRQGDRVVIARDDYPANRYVWHDLRRTGVEVVELESNPVSADELEDVLDERVVIVSLPTINYLTGSVTPVREISSLLRRRNVLFCLDGIQSIGAFPVERDSCDILCAGAHKWLLGPQGVAILYVRRDVQPRVHPLLLGDRSTRMEDGRLVHESTGKRFEPGTQNIMGIVGLDAALGLILEIGIDRISEQILRLRQSLFSRLTELGLPPLGRPHDRSGIVSVPVAAGAQALFTDLDRHGMVVSIRASNILRMAPHFYNVEEEVDRFCATVGRLATVEKR